MVGEALPPLTARHWRVVTQVCTYFDVVWFIVAVE